MHSKEKISQLLRGVFWDYNIDPFDAYLIALGQHESIEHIDKNYAFKRIFEVLSWYELNEIFTLDYIKSQLNDDINYQFKNPAIKRRYDLLRSILFGKTLSPSGWSDENRKRLKASILSDRWNRP